MVLTRMGLLNISLISALLASAQLSVAADGVSATEVEVLYPRDLSAYASGSEVPLIFGYNKTADLADSSSATIVYSVTDSQSPPRVVKSGSIDASNTIINSDTKKSISRVAWKITRRSIRR